MHDAGVGRHDPEVGEGLLAPLEEQVAFPVALELQVGVGAEGGGSAVGVHLHRVIDHQVGRLQRIDPGRVAAHPPDGVTHGGQVRHGGHAREVLQKDARRDEGDLSRRRLRTPRGQGGDVVRFDRVTVLVAQEILQEHPQREGQPVGMAHACFLQRVQAEHLVRRAAHRQGGSAAEAVGLAVNRPCHEVPWEKRWKTTPPL